MNRVISIFVKEVLLLKRDKAGLAMLFVMPVLLVMIMTLLQDSTFKKLDEKQLPVLIINHDADTFGINIVKGISETKFFKLTINNELSTNDLINKIEKGEFLIGIVINEGATNQIRNSIKNKIQDQFPKDFEKIFDQELTEIEQAKVNIYFDPILKNSYKQSILGALRQFSALVEAQLMFNIYSSLFNDLLDIELNPADGFNDLIVFDEQYASSEQNSIVPNSVQHNIPAWTIFAMFFIVIPLASNIIKERQSGVSARLRTIPGSRISLLLGKALAYFVVGICQAILMLIIGIWLLPIFGLPTLQIGDGGLALFMVTVAIIIATTAYGIVIGSIAGSEQQSSIFGSLSVVILAAIGGVWVPAFMMSDLMIKVSKLSPLNWGLDAYYDIFLRNSGVVEVLPNIALLLIFSMICLLIASIYSRKQRA